MFCFQVGKKFRGLFLTVFLGWSTLYLLLNRSSSLVKDKLADENPLERIDWEDYDFVAYEETRNGPGERSGYTLTDPEEIARNEELLKTHGVSIVVSDKISLTRALTDQRHDRLLVYFHFDKLVLTSELSPLQLQEEIVLQKLAISFRKTSRLFSFTF